jgi:hypothetical protein
MPSSKNIADLGLRIADLLSTAECGPRNSRKSAIIAVARTGDRTFETVLQTWSDSFDSLSALTILVDSMQREA